MIQKRRLSRVIYLNRSWLVVVRQHRLVRLHAEHDSPGVDVVHHRLYDGTAKEVLALTGNGYFKRALGVRDNVREIVVVGSVPMITAESAGAGMDAEVGFDLSKDVGRGALKGRP
jgi:hypothetical protein